jgi:biopolymer transport protein TolR
VPYGTVVQVMDGVKRAGIEKLGMVTDPPGARPPERVGESPMGVTPSERR